MSLRLKSIKLPSVINWKVSMQSCLLVLFATVVTAAPPAWTTKPVAQWTVQDAYALLSDSPWVRRVAPAVSAGLTKFQREDGGNFAAQGGGNKGVGFDDFTLTGQKGAAAPRNGQGPEGPRRPDKILVRWESAMPVRAAEIKANEVDAPELEGDEYAIAVYGLSLKAAALEQKGMNDALKKAAALQIEGKKDLKPSRVAAVELGGGMMTVVYLFPRSAALSLEDKRIEFRAQIGRIFVAQYFYPELMQFQGKLAL